MHRPALICIFLITWPAMGQEVADRHEYSILNPTPRELWRPLRPDRPGRTENPFTVDAGAVQIEAGFVDYSRNGDAETWKVAPTNFRLGLLHNVDLQVVLEPWVHQDDGTSTDSGLGDTDVRLKINLWGNDEGPTALGLLPFITIPTAEGDNHLEGGLSIPFSVDLAEGIQLGLMAEADFIYETEEETYRTDLVTSGVLGFGVTEQIGLYVEGVGTFRTDGGGHQAILGLGGTYGLSPDVILDAGVNIGLTGDADDVNAFAGITFRF